MTRNILIGIALFVLGSLASLTLLVRLVYRYNAPIMRIGKKKRSTRHAFTAEKSRQLASEDGDYYIVEYAWTEGRKRKAYACRVIGKPPETIKLGYGSFRRLVVVEGPVDRMDNQADPYIAYSRNPFPKAGYLLVLVPAALAVLLCMYVAAG